MKDLFNLVIFITISGILLLILSFVAIIGTIIWYVFQLLRNIKGVKTIEIFTLIIMCIVAYLYTQTVIKYLR